MSNRKNTAAPTVDLDATRQRLERLNMPYAAEQLEGLISDAVKHEHAAHRVVDRLLDAELERREERRLQTSLRLSGLPTGQTLGNFDFSFQPSVERSRIETLATCQWVRENRTLLIQGPPGVGKTHLGVALGVKAIEHGFGVMFHRLDELLPMMRRDAELPPSLLRRKKYINAGLLILDEVGFEPMSRQDASLFFRLVSHRYQKGAMVITTNKDVEAWPEILAGDEVLATAILDRLLHHSHVLNIKGRSYRLRDLEAALAKAS
jgi:DNA replication protein DnaC